jgi:predicted SprT family Zn-dependent metalloprotease
MARRTARRIGSVFEACEAYGIPTDRLDADLAECRVIVNPRLRTSLGKARQLRSGRTGEIKDRWIEIHPRVYRDHEKMRDTLAHEVAHLIVGIHEGHSRVWSACARALGSSGRAKYTVEEAAALGMTRTRRHVGTCERCGAEIHRTQRLDPGARYKHTTRGCGGHIIRKATQ